MRYLTVAGLLFGACVSALSADEPKPTIRPISEADSVLSVYYSDWDRFAARPVAIIFAAWTDGRVVWSSDRLRGGPPYKEGRVEPKKIAALLNRFDTDGLFAAEELKSSYFDPHGEFLTVLVKSGKKRVKMHSHHELIEEAKSEKALQGKLPQPEKRRLDILKDAPREYLFFRLVWADTRARMADLIPAEGTPTNGKAVMKGGDLSWHEPASAVKVGK